MGKYQGHMHPIERRRKQYAPMQDVAVLDEKKPAVRPGNFLGSTFLKSDRVCIGSTDEQLAAHRRSKPIRTYKGIECSKCHTRTRERGTDKCMYCHGPDAFRLAHDQKTLMKTERSKTMLQRLSLPKHTDAPAPHPYVTMAVRDGAVFQAEITFPQAVFEAIGKPDCIDVVTLPQEWTIQKGFERKLVKDGKRYVSRVAAAKLNLGKRKRATIRLDTVFIKDKVLHIPRPEVWEEDDQPEYHAPPQAPIAEAAPPVPPAPKPGQVEIIASDAPQPDVVEPIVEPVAETAPEAPAEPEAPILEDTRPKVEPVSEAEIGLSVSRNGSSAVMRLSIPVGLLVELGTPPKIEIIGTAAEGFRIFPRKKFEEGLVLNYNTGLSIYTSIGFTKAGLSKDPRKVIKVRGVVDHGVLRVSGPNYEWIRAAPIWLRPSDQPTHSPVRQIDPASVPAPQQPITNGNGHASVHVEQASPVTPPTDMQTTKALLDVALSDARKLKADLEKLTGMQYGVTKDFRLFLL